MIDNYVPYGVAHTSWMELRTICRAVVLGSGPADRDEARVRMNLAVKYLVWASEITDGSTANEFFDPRLVSRYAASRRDESGEATARRNEQRLRRIAAAANGGNVAPSHRQGPTAIAQPYDDAESARQDSWAIGHPQSWRRRDAAFILAIGRGAGLETSEIQHLRTADLDIRQHQELWISVKGTVPRMVPVFQDSTTAILDALEEYEIDDYLLSEHSRRVRELMQAFQNRTRPGRPVPKRLRSSWLIRHLELGTPLPNLLEIAGLTSTSTLNRYMPFVRVQDFEWNSLLTQNEVAR